MPPRIPNTAEAAAGVDDLTIGGPGFMFRGGFAGRSLALLALLVLATAPAATASAGTPAAARGTPARRAHASRPAARRTRPRRAGRAPDADLRREQETFDRMTNGPVTSERYLEMWKAAQALPSEPPPAAGAATNTVNGWELVGPLYSVKAGGGNMTGRVRDIDAHNRRVLAASGGLWRFNFGPIAMSDSVPATWFGSFASRPSDPNTILLGTGEYAMSSGTGLYKTTDGGATWTLKPSAALGTFSRIRYAPDGVTAYAAGTGGFYRSTNGGETWSRTLSNSVSDFATVPAQPLLVLATVETQGLWRSVDGGVTWGHLVNGGIPAASPGRGAVTAIQATRTNAWVYVAFSDTIFRSQDDGATWTNVSPPYNVGNSGYGPAISVCPTNPSVVLFGDVSFNRTDNAGATWSKISSGNLHADYHAFAWDDDGVGVWAGNDGGWFHSLDAGLTWDSSANVMPVTQFYTLECEHTETGYMLGGAQDNNVLVTPTEALYWSDPALFSTEGDAYGVALDVYNPSHLWAVSGVAGPPYAYPHFRSLDGGTSWQEVDTGIAPNAFAGQMRTDNAFPVQLYTSAGFVLYESADGGDHWTRSNPTDFPGSIIDFTSSTRVSPNSVLYVCLSSGLGGPRLYVRDGGAWSDRSAGLPFPGVALRTVVPHPWAAYADEAWGILFNNHILHTTNRGASWTDVTGDLPVSIPVTGLVVNPHNTNELYIGTYLGCFRSLNGGTNWERWTNGMPPTAKVTTMTYIDLSSTTGQFFVVAATFGRSAWRRDITGFDPMPSLTVGNASCAEGNAGPTSVHVPVTLSAPQALPVIVDWATGDGTATVADNDYVAASGQLVIPAGESVGWIPLTVNGDTRVEPDESFTLSLSNPVRATVANVGTVGVMDDDQQFVVMHDLPVTNGAVSALASAGDTLYVGGNFTRIGPASGGGVPIALAGGHPQWLPKVAGVVYAAVPDGAGGWYIGGSFTAVAGSPRANLAHLLADHTLAPWNPGTNDLVFALAVDGPTVYVGGRFTSVGPFTRNYLAAVDGASGDPTPWNPAPDGQVLALLPNGHTLYAGGSFLHVGTPARVSLAAFSTSTGGLTPWDAGANGDVSSLSLVGARLYVAGGFTGIGGATRHYLAAVDTASGLAYAWDPEPDNYAFSLLPAGASVIVGGAFANIGTRPLANLAAVDSSLGHATSWTPNVDGNVLALAVNGPTLIAGGTFANAGGQPRNNLAALDLSSGLATSWNPDPDNTVVALAPGGGSVFAGGTFTTFASVFRRSLAAVDLAGGQVLPWNPGGNGSVTAFGQAPGTLFVGGSFDTVGAQPRGGLAALDPATGVPTAWNPGTDGAARTMLVLGNILYVGGQFTTIGVTLRSHAAAFDLATGALVGWNPNASGTVNALATDGTLVYAGGAFATIGGQTRPGLAALSAKTGAANAWTPTPNGVVTSIVMDNTALYVGGAFTSIAGSPRARGALMTTTALSPWNPGANGTVTCLAFAGITQLYLGGTFTSLGGAPHGRIALARSSTSSVADWTPDADGGVSTLALAGDVVIAGGSFGSFGGLPQAHLAAFVPVTLVGAPSAGSPEDFALGVSPNPTAAGVRLDYTLPVAGRVRITFYDVQGRRVGPRLDQALAAGPHELTWDGAGDRGPVRPGLYFARVEANGRQASRRFAVVH